jgi:acyl-coenzyme A thioesterase PaaI-like protein
MSRLPKLPKLSKLAGPAGIRQLWGMLKRVPKGGKLMGALVGRMAPYTGTIAPEILELDLGRAKVQMRDRKAVRNHLNCIHAIALMNLGEVATGTAMLYSMPEDARAIIVNLSMEYKKKARGTLIAEATCPVPSSSEKKEYVFSADLKDARGDVVAVATARWLVGPAK